MKKSAYFGLLLVVVLSCAPKAEVPKHWVFEETIELNEVNPIGVASLNDQLWLSDGDHNRLVQIDVSGKIVKTKDSLDRPMHIASDLNALYVPQYGKDEIVVFDGGKTETLDLKDSLDAPAGISIWKNEKAIADFYNNRILYYNGVAWQSIGQEGKEAGAFYYPTDVQITEDKIWVADAYNHRIQVFDKEGNFLKMIGHDQKMNAATGIYVARDEVFITDFENNRILIFDKEGMLKQELKEGIHKPTDMMLYRGKLLVLNYRQGSISRFASKEIAGEVNS